jgi:hypothetical protein
MAHRPFVLCNQSSLETVGKHGIDVHTANRADVRRGVLDMHSLQVR